VTASDTVSDTGGYPAGNTGPADDTEDCLCLVAGYSRQPGLIARVTAETEKRVLMSPALGDFLRLRHVDLGQHPGELGDRSRPVRHIVTALMAEQETAGRSHFALLVIAKSAVVVEELAGICSAEPFLSGLRMRFAGIASTDDRDQQNRFSDILVSPGGAWRSDQELIYALRQRCAELPGHFAVRGDPGLTRAEVAALRQQASALAAAAPEAEDRAHGSPEPDVLDDVQAADVTADMEADQAADVSPPAERRPSRWLPRVPRLRGLPEQQPADQDPVEAAGPAPTMMGLVYVLVIADPDNTAGSGLGELRPVLPEIDRGLAERRASRAFQVRLIEGHDGALRGELRDPGRFSRRDSRRVVQTADFAAVLRALRGSLRRDEQVVGAIATASGLSVMSPAVVILAADPPVADLGAAAAFRDLAAEASVLWVVPKGLQGLVSPAFGTTVLGAHPAVAQDVLDVLNGVTSGQDGP
jgi:hypothetical protein